MLLVESYIRENLKYTDDLICETFSTENFMKKIQKIAQNVIDYAEEHILKPLKKLIVDWLLRLLPETFKKLYSVVSRFFKAAKLFFKITFKVFRKVFNFIKAAFNRAIRFFINPLSTLKKWFLTTLRLIWKGLVKVVEFAVKGSVFVARKGG